LLPLAFDWQQMLLVLAVASLAIGNITAIVQTNLKRMLAYSTIAQMGFVLLGMASGVTDGNGFSAVNAYSSAMFYTITYVMTTLGTFGILLLLSRQGFEAENIDDLKGLNQRSPWFALVMMLFMLSLAGIPPMMGFYAKLSVLQAVLGTGHIWLAVLAVFFSLVGAYYYLRVIKVMYFDEPISTEKIVAGMDMRIVLSLNGVAVVALGLMPGALMTACETAVGLSLRAFVRTLY
jgi:NADH-quinone oxidoreductase subunit N